MRACVCVCVPYRELSLSVCLSLSLRGDDEETKTRVLYLIEKVFIQISKNLLEKISKKTRGKKFRVLIELGFT